MLVWLASYPRSGNRFFRTAAVARYRLLARDKYVPVPEDDLYCSQIKALGEGAEPAALLVKTHDLPGDDRHPAIYLLRDGRDALVSYAHFALDADRKVVPGAVTPELFRSTLRDLILEERSAYGTWARNVRAWTARPNTVVVRYEDLVLDPGGEVDRALAAVGWPSPRVADEVPTFDAMKRARPAAVRRGVVGSWEDEFPPDLLPLFWERNGDVMRACGYTAGEPRPGEGEDRK